MYHGKIRLAVCQIECHPAIKVGNRDYTCEPFVPSADTNLSLASLSNDFNIIDLQEQCKEEYLNWHTYRLKNILNFFKSLKEIPDIIVFPEGSIPLTVLPLLRDFAAQNKKTILAGTHSLCLTGQWERIYKRLGMDTKTQKKWASDFYIVTQALTIFNGSRTFFRRKLNPSIFEVTDVNVPQKSKEEIEPIPVQIDKQTLNLAALVCSEALREHNIVGDYDIAVVSSYSPKQDAFGAFIEHQIKNKKAVVLANDGHFGGSGVFIPIDKRMKPWWWDEDRKGQLETGDGVIIVEVDFDNIAPQVGVSNPQPAAKLELISALTYEYDTDSGYKASKTVEDIQKNQDNRTQAEVLSQVLSWKLPTIQRVKLNYLHQLADNMTADSNWWAVLGRDCLVENQMGICGLEAKLAQQCADRLSSIITSGAIDYSEKTLGRIAKYLVDCHKKMKKVSGTVEQQIIHKMTRSAIVDRQDKIKEILDFLNHQKQAMCLIVGINSVGKTSVISNAIDLSGHQNIYKVKLLPDTTPEYICKSLLVQLGCSIIGNIDINSDRIAKLIYNRLPTNSIILIEDAHFCISHHVWRDGGFPKVFDLLMKAGIDHQCKIIIETAIEIDLEAVDPNYVKRCWIKGLEYADGVNLLKQQLRRAGLEPKNYDDGQCKQIVENLGEHPGAIILASEYIEKSTISQVAEDIQKRKGHASEIVRRIIKGLDLNPDESLILSLLSLARRPVPVKVIARTVEFDGIGILHDLYKSALVERQENDHVCVTELLKNFADLPILEPNEVEIFHEEAAKAFAELAKGTDPAQQLEWIIESRYHAYACGKPELAPDIGDLADGVLGACKGFIKDKEYDKAKPIIERLLKTRRTRETIELASVAYAHLGECDEALVLAKEANSGESKNTWIFTEVGRCALNFNRVDIAESAVALAKATGTLNTYISILEGRIFLRRGKPQEAAEAFQIGVDISERDGWPHFYLGRELIRQDNIPDAIKVLEKGEEIEAGRWRHRRNLLVLIRTQLGVAYLLDGDLPNAETWLKLVAGEGNPEVARAFAWIKIKANKGVVTEKALEGLNPANAKNRLEKCQMHLFRGLFFLNAGIPGKASDEFRSASRADPRNLFVLLRWAESLIEIARDAQAEGEHEAARNCAEQAKTVAEKVLEFDGMNEKALKILERLSDEFNIL
jgi:tetratricopeptide (TPR) repeat protein